ncbi:MAG: HAD family hydrolase [Anaerolineaceae bacterium]
MEKILSGIEAIFFDIDGTLSDSDDQIIEEIVKRMRFLHFLWKDPLLRKFARGSVSLSMAFFNSAFHIVDSLGLDNFIAKTFPHRHVQNKDDFEKDINLITGVEKMIAILHARYRLGIVSARSEPGVLHFLKQFSLEKYFDVVVAAQTCYYTKPFPHPLLYAAEVVKVLPEKCLMVGDTMVDIVAGKAAGMKTIGVLCGFGTLKELRKAAADFILASPAELISLLD